jgi:hypothetical protein
MHIIIIHVCIYEFIANANFATMKFRVARPCQRRLATGRCRWVPSLDAWEVALEHCRGQFFGVLHGIACWGDSGAETPDARGALLLTGNLGRSVALGDGGGNEDGEQQEAEQNFSSKY